MGLWLLFSIFLIVIFIFLRHLLRQKEKKYEIVNKSYQNQLRTRNSKVQEKVSKNLQFKEKFLKITSGKEKLKGNLEKYRKENKSLQETSKKKRKQRSDAGKHRDVSNTFGSKRTGKLKGAKGGGLKSPGPKEIDYTRHWYLDSCPKCKETLKSANPIGHHDHYLRDLEKLKRGIRLIYAKHVIYRYKCPHCGKIVSKNFGKLKNARYGIGMIAFVLYERLEQGGSW